MTQSRAGATTPVPPGGDLGIGVGVTAGVGVIPDTAGGVMPGTDVGAIPVTGVAVAPGGTVPPLAGTKIILEEPEAAAVGFCSGPEVCSLFCVFSPAAVEDADNR